MSNIQFIRGILYSLFYCNISDIFLSKTTGLNRKAKWYLIHSICNLFILIHSSNVLRMGISIKILSDMYMHIYTNMHIHIYL